jgi:LPS-assembly protein
MQKLLAHAFLFALLLAITGQARATESNTGSSTSANPTGTTTIDAQRLEILLDRKLRAIGDAEVHQDDKAIFGDQIHYDTLNDEVHVIGNARLEQTGMVVQGQEFRLQMEDRVGEMKDPVFTLRQTGGTSPSRVAKGIPGFSGSQAAGGSTTPNAFSGRGDAKEAIFEGPGKERLMNARYTTCPAGVDDWFLRAKELELDHQSETGTAKNASIEFKGVPIFYTPWINFPFENQRKSGLLTPTFGNTTRTGAELSVPYYWNISPNMDATITPRYLSKLGLQTAGEFRYLTENYFGQDNIEYLPNDQQTDQDRYYYKLTHQHTFGSGWSGGFNYEKVSDDNYFSDLTTNIAATSRVNLAQSANVHYDDNVWHFTGTTEQYQTLDGASYVYKRLPQLSLTGNKDWDVAISNIYTQWTRFDQDSDAPPTVTGNRFVAYPSISMPITRPFFYVTPKLGFHHTQYDLGGNTVIPGTTENYQSDSVSIPTFSVDSGLMFDRNFRVMRNAYTQTLEPRLYYVYIPYQDQSQLPVFDTAKADLNMGTLFSENQFSGNDRVNNANQVSLAITSRIIDEKTGAQRLAATIGQRFYFTDEKVTLPGATTRDQNSSDIITALTARLLTHWNIDAAWQYNTDSARTVKSDIGGRYNPEPGKVLNLSYRFTEDSLEQLDFSSEWPLSSRWYGLARWNYSIRDSKLVEGIAGAEYNGGCWQARAVFQRVSPAIDQDPNYAFFMQLELGGLASIGTSPLSLLKRSITGYSSSALIPTAFGSGN